jgi:hypothetical protein
MFFPRTLPAKPIRMCCTLMWSAGAAAAAAGGGAGVGVGSAVVVVIEGAGGVDAV